MKNALLSLCLIFFFTSSLIFARYLRCLVILSGSMEPTIRTKDLVLIVKVKDYYLNEIIAYAAPDGLITHRIIKIENSYVFTKGDNNLYQDPAPINKLQIIGKVALVLPRVGGFLSDIVINNNLWLSFYFPIGFVLGKLQQMLGLYILNPNYSGKITSLIDHYPKQP